MCMLACVYEREKSVCVRERERVCVSFIILYSSILVILSLRGNRQ